MPSVSLPLTSINTLIVSNSIYGIAREIADIIKVANTLDIITMYNGNEVTVTDGKVNISDKKVTNLPTTISTRRLLVNITDNYNEDALGTTSTTQEEQFAIFRDNSIDVSIYPIYIQTDYNIEFTYITPSKSEIIKIVDDIRMNLSRTRNMFIHDIEYDYIIPSIVEDFILDVYTNKNRLVPSSLEIYFRENSTGRIHIVTDLVGNNSSIAIREKQVRIVGLFDFSPMPDKPSKEDEVYKFVFNYKLTLDKPSHLVLRYPIMIGNKLLPLKYIDFLQNRDIKTESNRNLSYSNSLYSLSYFEAHRQLENRINITLPINLPSIDEYKTKFILKGYIIAMSLMTEIDEIDNVSLLNLNDITPYVFNPLILEYIILEKQYITKPYSSFIYLGLYQDKLYFDADILSIDNALNIKSTIPLNLMNNTRVLFNYATDISILLEQVMNRLLTYRQDIIIAVYTHHLISMLSIANTDNIPYTNRFETLFKIVYKFITLNDYVSIDSLLSQIYIIDIKTFGDFVNTMQDSYHVDIYNNLVLSVPILRTAKYTQSNMLTRNYIQQLPGKSFMKTVETSYIVALKVGD